MNPMATPPLQPCDSPPALPAAGAPPLDAARARRLADNRAAAAAFIAAATGAAVPHATDAAFRAALADGATLCRLLNALRPGAVPRVAGADGGSPGSATEDIIAAFENVQSFLAAAREFTADTFSAADLEDPEGERPAVAECILSLRDWQAAAAGGGGTPAAAAAPPGAPPPSFTPEAEALVARHGGAAADGAAALLAGCSRLLKGRMGVAATPPGGGSGGTPPGLDAVGPMLERVLGGITADYEARLAARDAEAKAASQAAERARHRASVAEAEAAVWRRQAEAAAVELATAVAAAPADGAAAAEARARLEAAQAAAAAARAALAEREEALAAALARARAAEAEAAELRPAAASAAALARRYDAARAENRALYAAVQDLKGAVRVFCRVRPAGVTRDASERAVDDLGPDPTGAGALLAVRAPGRSPAEFRFDAVFGERSTAAEVYAEVAPLVRSVLDGFDACVFAYGQTGSGKTHTMAALNAAALEELFELAAERGAPGGGAAGWEYSVDVQLLEVYNEVVRDLLAGGGGRGDGGPGLAVSSTARPGEAVPDARRVPVGGAAEVLAVLGAGAARRAVAGTAVNERSSRSHLLLTAVVEGRCARTGGRSRGVLHLVDLAGSERVKKSGAAGATLLEAQHINRSLSALGGVMAALAARREHVPFRDSKLTQLLAASLAARPKAAVFLHVAPEAGSAGETLSTCAFGRGVTEITLGAARRDADAGGGAAAAAAAERAARAERDAADARRAAEAAAAEAADLRAQLAEAKAAAAPLRREASTIAAYRPAGVATPGAAKPGLAAEAKAAPMRTPLAPAVRASRLPTPASARGSGIPRPAAAAAAADARESPADAAARRAVPVGRGPRLAAGGDAAPRRWQ